jgi:hypothetical protein
MQAQPSHYDPARGLSSAIEVPLQCTHATGLGTIFGIPAPQLGRMLSAGSPREKAQQDGVT